MEKVTTIKIREMKNSGEKIVMLATYDYLTAKMVDEAGADAILVGDSLANVVLGHRDTLSVGMEEMLHHTKAVARGVKRALVVGDMPFMSYQASTEDAIRNAGRFLKEGHAEAVKVEGGHKMIRKVEAIIDAGIPVMGHLGLTPQWVHQFGGYRVRGKTWSAARAILEDAQRLERAGVFSLVLEAMPWQLAKLITEKLEIPTIGIGAGPYCDGQVLVLHDLIGLTGPSVPKFVKRYAELDKGILKAVEDFKRDVKSGKFPALAQSYEMPPEEMRKLIRGFRQKK
ncbi:MAG: 3-methyl-2-oxobutanoate hydroxymethyltransferase [Candidatus Hadarchaeum sp.]|uniref:3-methyl-2-oxobutanoate hydroxymethyltransferase n=1 Tax=Candidatus Hadarchaeum sp. TaxID=2883567 RepID=UPI003D105431